MAAICNSFLRLCTIGLGGLLASKPNPPPVGTKLRLIFEVPGGNVRAEAIVRNVVPGQGMGVELTTMDLKDKIFVADATEAIFTVMQASLDPCRKV
jgi:hypothetical protein